MVDTDSAKLSLARDLAAAVVDPEIPVLTLDDLGVLRDVRIDSDDVVHVVITPTYSGCPALNEMKTDLVSSLNEGGFSRVLVDVELEPAWSSNDMSEAGRRKLKSYGIAPPVRSEQGSIAVTIGVVCPRCESMRTALTSAFGATSCKSMWKCRNCQEVFEHFKSI